MMRFPDIKKLAALGLAFVLTLASACGSGGNKGPTVTPSPSPTPAEPTASTLLPTAAEKPETTGVVYKTVGDQELALDIILPEKRSGPAPLLVMIHGGSFTSGSREDMTNLMPSMIELLCQNGFAVATIDYRLISDTVKYPAPAEDCADALRYLVKNAYSYGLDTENIGLLGISAGGYLSLMAALAKNKGDEALSAVDYTISYVVDLCGPTQLDLKKLANPAVYTSSRGMIEYLLGSTYEKHGELYKKASPLSYISNDTPDMLIVHGTLDPVVPLEQAELLYAAASRYAEIKLIKVENGGHTFEKVSDAEPGMTLPDIFEQVTEYILSQKEA